MFKSDFKYYKRKTHIPDYSSVVDFHNLSDKFEVEQISVDGSADVSDDVLNLCGLNRLSDWRLFKFKTKPGLVYIKNPFTSHGQRYWSCRCLQDFPCGCNRTNLDSQNCLNKGETWWNAQKETSERGNLVRKKLRWVTLGYHHNWDTKVYSEDCRSDFPKDLKLLTTVIAKSIGYPHFTPEAAIINFYHSDSTLSGHTDHSEINKEAPLFSFSFGQSAIFLIGGQELEEKPVAIMIHSGDILIMSGESRLCYHGIPKIVVGEDSPWDDDLEFVMKKAKYNINCSKDNKSEISHESTKKYEQISSDGDEMCDVSNDVHLLCDDNVYWNSFSRYLKMSRINMNVRQVLKNGQKHL